jgi:hypothetical protein
VKQILSFNLLFFLIFFSACITKPDFPIEPYLEYTGMDKNIMIQGDFNSDSIFIYLKFTDGDGDLGFEAEDSLPNLFVIDSRTDNIAESIKIPKLPDTGTGNGVSGEIELKLYTTCCLFSDNIPPCSVIDNIPTDTLYYKIYMIDRAGHSSDTVYTDPIILECK